MNSDIKQIQFMARREDWSMGISLYARQASNGAGQFLASPVEFKEQKGGLAYPPFLTIGVQEAQALMDELWQCGLRPSEGAGSAGSLAATERHLADMRTVAFKKLGIEN